MFMRPYSDPAPARDKKNKKRVHKHKHEHDRHKEKEKECFTYCKSLLASSLSALSACVYWEIRNTNTLSPSHPARPWLALTTWSTWSHFLNASRPRRAKRKAYPRLSSNSNASSLKKISENPTRHFLIIVGFLNARQ